MVAAGEATSVEGWAPFGRCWTSRSFEGQWGLVGGLLMEGAGHLLFLQRTASGPPTEWHEIVQAHDDRDGMQASSDELPVIDIHSLWCVPARRRSRGRHAFMGAQRLLDRRERADQSRRPRQVSQLSHEHWYRIWGGVRRLDHEAPRRAPRQTLHHRSHVDEFSRHTIQRLHKRMGACSGSNSRA